MLPSNASTKSATSKLRVVESFVFSVEADQKKDNAFVEARGSAGEAYA